jgi:hypothetical protein
MEHKITSLLQSLSSKRLTSYSLFSTAFLLAGVETNAQVIYTDVDPDESYIGDGESYDLDLNNDGTTDFIISIKSAIYPGMFYTVSSGATFSGIIRSVYINPYPGNEIAGSLADGANAFNAYALVGPGMSFTSASELILDFFWGVVDYPLPGSIYSYAMLGDWPGVTDKFLAFRFQDAGETYYGWARLDAGYDCASFTIKDYAYNATPDTPIETGEMVAGNGINFADPTGSVMEDMGDYTGEVEIDNSADCSVDIVLNDALSTATNGLDFNFSSPLTLSFTAGGSTVLNFPVDIIDDLENETMYETMVFDLENITAGCVIASPDQLTINLSDDDTTFVSFDTDLTDAVENEGSISGKLNITWPVDCDLNISLSGAGTATEGIDFIFTDPTVVSFTTGGAFTEEFPIELIDDAAVEGNETIVFNLEYAGGGGCIVDPDYEDLTLTIIDNDATEIATQEILNANVFSFDQSIFVEFDPSVVIPAGFKLFDHNGKIVYEDILMNRVNTLIMNNLPNGIYTVQVISGNKKMEKNVYLWVK